MNYEHAKNLIDASGGRFCSVTFVKKSGEERTITFQPATAKFRCKYGLNEYGPSVVRKQNHPNLLNVWSTHDDDFRSINLDTILKICVNGQVHGGV